MVVAIVAAVVVVAIGSIALEISWGRNVEDTNCALPPNAACTTVQPSSFNLFLLSLLLGFGPRDSDDAFLRDAGMRSLRRPDSERSRDLEDRQQHRSPAFPAKTRLGLAFGRTAQEIPRRTAFLEEVLRLSHDGYDLNR